MHLSFNWRAMAAATLSLALATALTTQASALTDQEAATVVTLIERLQPELGPIAYDEEEAEIWFARDAVRERLIVKAGFTRQSWRAAFDATMRGYIATIPQARIDALFKQMRQRLEQAPRMTAEQRATAVEFVAAERERLDAIRTAGRSDAEVVRPFSARLSRLMESEIGEGTAED